NDNFQAGSWIENDFRAITLEFIRISGNLDISSIFIDYIRLTSLESPQSGLFKWTDLTDTDNSYIGKAGFIPQVLGTENGLKLVDPNTLGGGDFIPLTGTEGRSPVTGDIEIIDSNILIKNPASTFSSTFAFDEILFSNSNGISIAKDISLSRKNVGQSYLELDI